MKCQICRAKVPARSVSFSAGPNATASPVAKSTSVPGSGTAVTPAETAPPVTGDPACVGSKMNVPPAPTVRLPPAGRADAALTANVPWSTSVPPL